MTNYIPEVDPDNLAFPAITNALAEPQGLLAWGGDLSPARLLTAYQQGIFPWYNEPPVLWWAPTPRMVLAPSQVHISRSMKKLLKQNRYTVTFDCAFARVINHCAKVKRASQDIDTSDIDAGEINCNDHHTWINEDMQYAYFDLYRQGYAHSVEVWDRQTLVGGLYGVSIGKLFCGESMFSLVTNASKIAFVALCIRLQKQSFALIDCQLPTTHLASLGAYPIDILVFQRYLSSNQQLGLTSYWGDNNNKTITTQSLLLEDLVKS